MKDLSPNPLVVALAVILWLTVGCGLPLYRVHETRRQAHRNLLDTLATEKPDQATILKAFENSNREFDAAATGPCLIFAVSTFYFAWRLLKLEQRGSEIHLELKICRSHGAPSEAGSSD